jgi:hypothetical protein
VTPRVTALIDEHAGDAEVVVLRSRRAAHRYLAGATARMTAAALSG